jgi:hypothetical protein
MSSITRIVGLHGAGFNAGVIHAGEEAEQPIVKIELPGGSRTGFLAELPPAKDPAVRKELAGLMGEAFELDERIKQFALARFAEQYAGWEAESERAKQAVTEQLGVLEKLKRTLAEDSQDFSRAKNLLTQAQTVAWNEEQNCKTLSPFASKAERTAAEKRVVTAAEKVRSAEAKAGERGQSLNYLLQVTIPKEEEKRDALIERVKELSDLLRGRDPVLGKFSFQQR